MTGGNFSRCRIMPPSCRIIGLFNEKKDPGIIFLRVKYIKENDPHRKMTPAVNKNRYMYHD